MNYPYYIAITSEGRFKGQYPASIAVVPSLRRQWDEGKFGTGKKQTETVANSLPELIQKLQALGKNWRYDDVEMYQVLAHNSPRRRLRSHDVEALLRQ